MKKILLATTLAIQLYAGGDIEAMEINEAKIMETKEIESKFYIVASGMYMPGDTVEHEGLLLEGDKDYGFGIDFGYRIGNGFAVEYDFTYGSNTITENTEESKATYYTSAIDLVYVSEITETIGIFYKVGYEYEWETISNFDIDSEEHGFVFGVGTEVEINETYKAVLEYEYSKIKGPKGQGAFLAGVMMNF